MSTIDVHFPTVVAPPWLASLRSALSGPRSRACLTGLHGSTPAFALTLLIQAQTCAPEGSCPWLVVTADEESAERLFNDLRFFHGLLGMPLDNLAWF
ncbi:MAG: hypothetical protein NZM29_07915, partial [Nitrospira sp.]|nr:hypothetical protein [Nitrospira sp.]